jgi:hypothetical protein
MVLMLMNSEWPSMVLHISPAHKKDVENILGRHDLVVLEDNVFSPGGLSIDSVSNLELVALSSDNLE